MRQKTSLESLALTSLKKGKFFYSKKADKDLTAIASYYKKKIKTERLFIINPQKITIEKLTKVIIL